MTRFLLMSAAVHFILAVLSEFVFEVRPAPRAASKISVKLIKNTPLPNKDFPWGKIVDIPPPIKEEKPDNAEILAAFDSKAHAPTVAGEELLFDETSIPEKKAFPPDKTAKPAPVKRPATAVEINEPRKPQTGKEEPLQTASLPNPFMEAPARREEISEGKTDKIKYKKELEQISPRPEPQPGKTDDKTFPEKEAHEGDPLMSGEEVDFFIKNNQGKTLETMDELVISLNTQKLKYLAYFSAVRRAVESVWFYPDRAMINGIGGLALVRFTIGVDGWIEEAKIVSSSGEEILDKASLMAVKSASPFPPFPATLSKKRIHVVATFTYKPVFGAVP